MNENSVKCKKKLYPSGRLYSRIRYAESKGMTLEEYEAEQARKAAEKEKKRLDIDLHAQRILTDIKERQEYREQSLQKPDPLKELQEAEAKQDERYDWLANHNTSDPDYEKVIAEIHKAEIRIYQLTYDKPSDRIQGGIEVFSIQNQLNYRP